MISYRDQLVSALRAVAVTSSTSYAWFGSASRPLPRELRSALTSGAEREYLVQAIERELYRSFYTQGRPVPRSPDGVVTARSDDTFAEGLSRANTGAGGWESGWRIETVERGTVRVEQGGLRLLARASDCRPERGTRKPGAPVMLRRPKELTARSPGFYIAIGDAEQAPSPGEIELRVYYNVTAAGAAPLVGMCTRLLNEAEVPFSLKVLDHPTGFARCDVAVLYLENGAFARARESVSAIASACAPHLRSDLPAFAKPLTRGVAVGEHRSSLGGSFGSSRCRLVAEGIVTAHECGADRLADRVDAVARRFADRGLNVELPYLASESPDRYEL
jgi:hypothetical protein